MPERHEFFFHKYLEALNRTVVGIQKDLGKCAQLSSAIPAVRAMHDTVDALQHMAGY